VKLAATAGLFVPISDGDLDQFQVVVDGPDRIKAPVAAGQKMGVVRVLYKKAEIGAIDLIAAENIEKVSLVKGIWLFVLDFVNFFGGGFS
jgi:D-alanyl-D-alanine carboxypeptidase (penicillin-binding protein 5/6)